jgi:hypothetical protein
MYHVRLLFPSNHVIGLGQGAAVTALENDFLVPLFLPFLDEFRDNLVVSGFRDRKGNEIQFHLRFRGYFPGRTGSERERTQQS